MDIAEAIDNFIDWVSTHGFFLGFISGAALVGALWMI
jgi:cysteine synthase